MLQSRTKGQIVREAMTAVMKNRMGGCVMRRIKGLFGAVVMVVMFLAVTNVCASAAQGYIVPLYEKAYDFGPITIPATGTVYDSEQYIMSDGKYCKCYLESSGGWAISVRVVDYYSLSPLSDWVGVDQGQTKLIWTNNTGQTKYIRFELSSVWPWSIRAEGQWLFGPF